MAIKHPATGALLKVKEDLGLVKQGNLDPDKVRFAYVDLHGLHSSALEDVKRAMYNDAIVRQERRKSNPTYDEQQIQSAELLAAATAGWLLVDFDGEVIDEPFSYTSAFELFLEPSMSWLKKQVDAFLAEDSNFIKAS